MRNQLDPVIHPPKRLAAMALLVHASSTDFRFLRDHLGVSDSDLSKQMAELNRVGYVRIDKQGRGRGATTTYRVTRTGRHAYAAHRAALEEILNADVVPGLPEVR